MSENNKDVVEACSSWTCLVERSPPQVVNNQVFTNQYVDSSNGKLALETFNLTMCEMRQINQKDDG